VSADVIAAVEHQQVWVVSQCPGGGKPADTRTDDDG
jgi:hypothetical protein